MKTTAPLHRIPKTAAALALTALASLAALALLAHARSASAFDAPARPAADAPIAQQSRKTRPSYSATLTGPVRYSKTASPNTLPRKATATPPM